MGLFLALALIGVFLVAGIGYSAWRQQQTRGEISVARKRGAEKSNTSGLTQRWNKKEQKDAPDNLEKALDSIKLTSASTARDANVDASEFRINSVKFEDSIEEGSVQEEHIADLSLEKEGDTKKDGDNPSIEQEFDNELQNDGEYDDMPSDEELALAQAKNRAEGKGGGLFSSLFFGKNEDKASQTELDIKEDATTAGTGFSDATANNIVSDEYLTDKSDLARDEFGEPIPLDDIPEDPSEDKANSNGIYQQVEHIPQVARADVEWLNISMSYSGLVSHLSAYIGGNTTFSVEKIMADIKDAEAQIGTRIKLHYRNTAGTSWRRLERTTGVDILELMMSIQLADRTGAVTEAQVTRFSSTAVDVAEKTNRTLHWSLDIDDAVVLGEELFEVGKKFDLVASIYLYCNSESGFAGRDIKTAATEARMQLNDFGAFEFYDRSIDVQKPLFTMVKKSKDGLFNWSTIENEQVQALQLFMYLPYISDPKWAYDEMVRIGHSIERSLGGTLVNFQGQELTKALSDEASDGIEGFAKMMKDRGMKPGGEVAMTLIGDV